MSAPIYEAETTPLGEQTLVPGVTPITERTRIAILKDAPLRPKKPQKALDIGLFDLVARNQLNLF